ncbi:hypothetical protein Q5P01_014073 [Channa striata]|uniref:Dual specificity protein phosphatase 19 n=1 Tax=Channa striata TaxID=64152 RepID=A0AA88ML92_CHASR|nr:hypothetical protein Q5P01_014073 [Channa striata]
MCPVDLSQQVSCDTAAGQLTSRPSPAQSSPFQSGVVMQSLTQEIQSFSRTRLRKQCTRVTSLSGRRIIETWKGSTITVVDDPAPPEKMLGYVPDTSWDLQVGTVKPYLLLGSQDAAHDFGILRKHKVSHILNVAFGVENAFPDLFIYKTVSILDHPDTDLLPHIQDCCDFIQQAHKEEPWSSSTCTHGSLAGTERCGPDPL